MTNQDPITYKAGLHFLLSWIAERAEQRCVRAGWHHYGVMPIEDTYVSAYVKPSTANKERLQCVLTNLPKGPGFSLSIGRTGRYASERTQREAIKLFGFDDQSRCTVIEDERSTDYTPAQSCTLYMIHYQVQIAADLLAKYRPQ